MLGTAFAAGGNGLGQLDVGAIFGVLFFGYLLYRQVQARPVPREPRLQQQGLFLIVGLMLAVPLLSGHGKLSGAALGILLASFVVGATLAVARAHTVKLWWDGQRLMRKGGALSISLWLVSVALHIGAGVLNHVVGGPAGAESATAMLYLAVASTVQQVALVQRGKRRRIRARAARQEREAQAARAAQAAPEGLGPSTVDG
ncbi:hypothetical protein [Rugosimonospora africana]|nr:hypothetical protein [Rugosimonospora africana]